MAENGNNLRLLTLRQLSAETGLSASTLYRLVEAGQIPFYRLPGLDHKPNIKGRIYFKRSEVLSWLGRLKIEPRTEF